MSWKRSSPLKAAWPTASQFAGIQVGEPHGRLAIREREPEVTAPLGRRELGADQRIIETGGVVVGRGDFLVPCGGPSASPGIRANNSPSRWEMMVSGNERIWSSSWSARTGYTRTMLLGRWTVGRVGCSSNPTPPMVGIDMLNLGQPRGAGGTQTDGDKSENSALHCFATRV